MDNETYEALKRIINDVDNENQMKMPSLSDVEQIKSWIDEVAKEYESEEWC